MAWTMQQRRALDAAGEWLREGDRSVFLLAGYAGTGKTTLAKHLAASAGGPVYFAAPTGKAAHVLAKSGVENASTIHKLIYVPKEKSKQRLRDLEAERAQLRTHDPLPTVLLEKVEAAIRAEHQNLNRPAFQLNAESPLYGAALLVVDEYSMIDEQMGEDLLSFGCPILALGDPGQLPPVRGNAFFSRKPDITLTEIHRQAADNPIIWLSKAIREGQSLPPGEYGDSRVLSREEVSREEIAQAVLATDQLLVGRNATRINSNFRARALLGRRSPLPEEGDKLVCLRNNHDTGLLNGQTWRARRAGVFDGSYVSLEIENEEGQRTEVAAHEEYFHGKQPEYWARKEAEEFDYGYALTVHKAQGSQWGDVLLFDEWHGKDRSRWLYTAVTRAAERITILQM